MEERKLEYGDKRSLFVGHIRTLQQDEIKHREYSRLKKAVVQLESQMKEYASKFQFAVTNSLDEHNLPMFKNRESRDAEVKSRLRQCKEYLVDKEMAESIEDQLVDVEQELKIIRHKLEFYKAWA